MLPLDETDWEILDATADDCENLEQIYLSVCFEPCDDGPEKGEPGELSYRRRRRTVLLSEIADRVRSLVGRAPGQLGPTDGNARQPRPGIGFDVFGTKLQLQNLVRDGMIIVIAVLSLCLTPDEYRDANGFSWEPIREVAKLFAAIFTAIIPVVAMLDAGLNGSFAWLLGAVTARDGSPHEVAYFWYTGLLSAFLDNAPTYLLFFELAGGDARELMGELSGTLAAISMGAVYMGALTYIGNAPNLMIVAIANERGIRMPSFFGYLMWAAAVLLPLFVLLTVLPVAPVLRLR